MLHLPFSRLSIVRPLSLLAVWLLSSLIYQFHVQSHGVSSDLNTGAGEPSIISYIFIPSIALGAPKKTWSSTRHGSSNFSPAITDTFYMKALNYQKNHELKKAASMYRELIKRKPGDFAAQFNLASIYVQAGLYEKAISIMNTLEKKHPDNPGLLINLAMAESGRKRPRKAIEYLDRASRMKDCPKLEALLCRGIALRQLGRFEEAEASYKKAEVLDPENPHLLFDMALLYDLSKRYSMAIRYYRAFLNSPNNVSREEKRAVEKRLNAIQSFLISQNNM